MRKIQMFALAIAVIATIAILSLIVQPSRKAPNFGQVVEKPIRVAVNLPLSGPIAVFMGPIPTAVQMGWKDVAPGQAFEIDVQDNGGTPAGAVSALRLQTERGFDVYISGSSEMSSAILGAVDKTNKPHFLESFDAAMVSRGQNRLRILPNYRLEAPLWIKSAKYFSPKKIAIVILNNAPIREEFSQLIIPKLKELGLELNVVFFEWDGTNYSLLIDNIAKWQPDMFMVSGYSVHLLPIIYELKKHDLSSKPAVFALDFVDLLHNGTDKDLLAGYYFMCPEFELRQPGSVADKWAAAWKSKTGSEPTYPAAYAYDMGQLIGRAAKQDRTTISHESLLRAQPFDGVSGRIELNAEGDLNSTLSICTLDRGSSAKKVIQ